MCRGCLRTHSGLGHELLATSLCALRSSPRARFGRERPRPGGALCLGRRLPAESRRPGGLTGAASNRRREVMSAGHAARGFSSFHWIQRRPSRPCFVACVLAALWWWCRRRLYLVCEGSLASAVAFVVSVDVRLCAACICMCARARMCWCMRVRRPLLARLREKRSSHLRCLLLCCWRPFLPAIGVPVAFVGLASSRGVETGRGVSCAVETCATALAATLLRSKTTPRG